MLIISAILLCAAIAWILFQAKVQISEDISRQQTNAPTAPAQAGNSLDFLTTLNAGNGTSTNILAPLPPPFVSVANTN